MATMRSRKSGRKSARRTRRTRKTNVSTAVKKYVRKVMPKTEMKQIWNHQNEFPLSTLTQVNQNTGPAIDQGTGQHNRIGNVINASGLHFKGFFYNNSTQETWIRMVILGYPTPLGNTDQSLNLFDSTQVGAVSGTNTITGLDAIYFPINKRDYKVYRDKTYKLSGSTSGAAGTNTKMFNHFVKFNGRKITYDVAWTAANWTYNIVLITADANDDTSTGTVVELSALTRFYYKDA